MNISTPFIQRPIMTILLMIGLLIFGVVGYESLPVSDLPNVDFPTIQVSATLPGASPETMASSIATPLERQFSTIAGIDSMTSSSALGNTTITLQFSLERNLDSAATDVQSAINLATRRLPRDMPNPPTYRKVNPAEAPIFYLALSSKTLPLSEVNKYAETFLAQRLSTINGVAQVNVFGSQKYAVRIQVNPDLLFSEDLSIDEVSKAVSAANVNLPTGTLQGKSQTYLIQSEGQLYSAQEYSKLIVAYKNGAPVYLNQLGTVIDDVENNKIASWYNGERAIILAIQRQPGSNTVAVVDDIRKVLPRFELLLPKGVQLKVVYDRSESIRASINEVKLTLLIAAIFVVLVIFLFLSSIRVTIIPSLALPLSIFGTFAFIYQLGFSLNNLTLLSLTLVIGFVIDDAIVMLENIVRHWEKGSAPLQAALTGSKEIGFTILSMTLSLAVVFVPILFLGGIIGRLFHEFAVTICIVILLSGFVSLTLTPMLCHYLLDKKNSENKIGWFQRLYEKTFEFYQRTLSWSLIRHRVILFIFLMTLVLTMILLVFIPKGFLPSEDTGQLFAFTETDPAASFQETAHAQMQVADIIQKNGNASGVISSVGVGGASSTQNSGRIFIQLKPRQQRSLSADELVAQLRPQLAAVPGVRVFMQNVPGIRIGGQLTKSPYQYTLQSSNIDELAKWAEILQKQLSALPGLIDVTSDLQFTGPQVHIEINRDKAAVEGVTIEDIENTLFNAFGTRQISTIYTSIDSYQVILEVDPAYQNNINFLEKIFLRSSSGKLVPLSAVTTITQSAGSVSINHQGQLPAVTLSFGLKPTVSLGQAVNQIDKLTTRLQLPPTLITSFQGTAQAFQSSMQGFGWLLLVTLLVIYIILGMLYESFVHPLTILSGLPAAGVGALLALLLFGYDLNLYSFIGIIMLMGIVKKNAIMMIDFALNEQRLHNRTPHDAIYQACLIRFRPIMMTTLAALVGTLPIALALGAGSESRRPLGVAVVGGLLVSQMLTLYITPVIYIYFEKLRARFLPQK